MVTPGPVEQAVTNFVDGGIYPEDDAIVTADLPSETLQSLGKLLDRARSDVETSIRELSRLSAPDIDGWISQAKQLKTDIDGSTIQSDEISQLGNDNAQLQEHVADSKAKVSLLQGEVSFNQTLVNTLDSIHQLRRMVEQSATATLSGSLTDAISGLGEARVQLQALGTFQTTTVAAMLTENLNEVEQSLRARLERHWEDLIVVKSDKSAIKLKSRTATSTFDDVAQALTEMDMLKPKILALWKTLDTLILGPCIARRGGKSLTMTVVENTIALDGAKQGGSLDVLLSDLDNLRGFLQSHLSQHVFEELSALMVPSLVLRLTSGPLPASVPADLGGISAFNEMLKRVSQFVQSSQSSGWRQTDALSAWIADAPDVWLQGRRAGSLHSMRQLLKRGLGNPRSVEHVETQTIVENDQVLGETGTDDDWDTAWDEDTQSASGGAEIVPARQVTADDEDDGSAWGWEDDGTQRAEGPTDDRKPEEDDEGEAWGWGDDERPESPTKDAHATLAATAQAAPKLAKANGGQKKTAPIERTVTLRESYHITALPEFILELIVMVVEDADNLSRSPDNPVAPAAQGLYELAAMLLAMYRANAPETYGFHESGNMFAYNDSRYLAEQLRLFADHHADRTSVEALSLDDAIAALEAFGKRAYSKEMDSQKTILADLLDGAQGFANCAEAPYAGHCDLAVTSVIDRIRQVNTQWKLVLSPSALLQSTGSLLSSVVSKIILDVEDMSDIQESESKALTSYFSSLESMDELFLPQHDEREGDAPVPLTAGYVPTWLKFQYLSNILDSSLVDIKYLWTEGGLSLEFTAEEVVDLIEALFAESPRRREAIGEIRRSAQ